jgi:hypothetical protein
MDKKRAKICWLLNSNDFDLEFAALQNAKA